MPELGGRRTKKKCNAASALEGTLVIVWCDKVSSGPMQALVVLINHSGCRFKAPFVEE